MVYVMDSPETATVKFTAMKRNPAKIAQTLFLILFVSGCVQKKDDTRLRSDLGALELNRGEIALCNSGNTEFGKVAFDLSCSDKVRPQFNLAGALLHSFEYPEAEKVFAKIIDEDPYCIMAYWGAAMCNFHPLWERPSQEDLNKGSRIIKLARSLITDPSSREAAYLETIATIYDQWDKLDHQTRLLKFEEASEKLHAQYPGDNEAAIFYALALRAAADPADKTFAKQKKAGEILNSILIKDPKHPGIAHYIIHVYDYPELADLGLASARQYASLAAASAHAQHMPSHIFTRMGLWDESIQSNTNSVNAAKCYAENIGIKGHWDEELHGLDYLMYAYLQKADDKTAKEQLAYFKTIDDVFPKNFKDAYSFSAIPARYAIERKDWKTASELQLSPAWFPWEKYYWERSNTDFARFLGDIHTDNLKDARNVLDQLKSSQEQLILAKEAYKANLVMIQVKSAEAWLSLKEGDKQKAIDLMRTAADMEDATEKHPVTPGEIIPARELLGDIYLNIGDHEQALEAYELNLKRHPNTFNGLYGAAVASEKLGADQKAGQYFTDLLTLAKSSGSTRPELEKAMTFVNQHNGIVSK